MNKRRWIIIFLFCVLCICIVMMISIADYYSVANRTVTCINSNVISEGVSEWYEVIDVQKSEEYILFSGTKTQYVVYYVDENGYQQTLTIPKDAFNIKVNEAESRICKGERVISRTYECNRREPYVFEFWLNLLPKKEKTWTVTEKYYWYVYEGVPVYLGTSIKTPKE